MPAYECSKRRAKKNCWSVGQQDTDCPSPDGRGYGLCCFDGCSNSCQYNAAPSYGKKRYILFTEDIVTLFFWFENIIIKSKKLLSL